MFVVPFVLLVLNLTEGLLYRINCWSKSGDKSAAKRATKILSYLEDSCNLINPDEYSYTTTIDAWAKSTPRDPEAPHKAEAILTRMENNPDVTPNTIAYNSVLNCWAKSSHPEAPRRAEALLRRMQYFHQTGINQNAKPDKISYNTVIMAWAKSDEKGSAQSAENLLNEMEKNYKNGNVDMKPSVFSYNSVVEAWTRSKHPNPSKGEKVLERLLMVADKEDLEVDSYGFNSLIHAHAKTGTKDSTAKIEDILRKMDEMHESGKVKVRADIYTYTTIMDAYVKAGMPDVINKIINLIHEMERKVESGQSDLTPNTLCYNFLLGAFRNSGTNDPAVQAEAWLERMEKEYRNGNQLAKPDVYSYNHVISAWTYSGAHDSAMRAEAVLKRMEENGVKINSFSYNGVMNAWSKSKRPRKAQKVLSILRGMDALYKAGNKDIRPNAYTYTTLLNACAFSSPDDVVTRSRVLDIALAALEELECSQYGNPNHVTYGTFLKACANLIAAEDEEMKRLIVEPVFNKACEDGQVGELVLKQLRSAAPSELYEKLVRDIGNGSRSITLRDIPPEWHRNVKENGRGRRRSSNVRQLKHREMPKRSSVHRATKRRHVK